MSADEAGKLEREAFEAYANKKFWKLSKRNGTEYYDSSITAVAWVAWQARAHQPEGESKDAARWRYCLEHGFPIRGPQWIAHRPDGSMVLGNSANEAIDRAMPPPAKEK